MNILHITPFFYEGLNYQEESLAISQSNSSHKVSVIKPMPLRRMEPKDSITEVRNYNLLKLDLFFDFKDRVIFKNLRKTILQINPDVIHCHCYLHLHSVQVALICKRYNIPVVFDEHSADFNTASNFLLDSLNKIIDYLIKFILPKRRVIFAAADIQDFFFKRFRYVPKNSNIIMSGVPNIFINSNPVENKYIDNKVNLIHIGNNISSRKGLEKLSKIAVYNPEIDFSLKIVGNISKEYKSMLLDNFSETPNINLKLVKKVKTSDLISELRGINVAFWPGDISISALLAISQGLTLFFPSRDSYSHHLQRSNAVFSFDENIDGDMLKSFKSLLESRSRSSEISKRARSFIIENHSWNSISQSYVNEYTQIINSIKAGN